MSHTDSALMRLSFASFRGGLVKKGPPGPGASEKMWSEYRFLKLWEKRTQESFLEDCDKNLDTILLEIDQMVLDLFDWVEKLDLNSPSSPMMDRHSWAAAAMTRFPYVPVERDTPATKEDYIKGTLQLASHYGDWVEGEPNFDKLPRFKFARWRDLPQEEFLEFALKEMPLLIDDHEVLRAMYARTVNNCHDTAGWTMRPWDIADRFRHTFLWQWPTSQGD